MTSAPLPRARLPTSAPGASATCPSSLTGSVCPAPSGGYLGGGIASFANFGLDLRHILLYHSDNSGSGRRSMEDNVEIATKAYVQSVRRTWDLRDTIVELVSKANRKFRHDEDLRRSEMKKVQRAFYR